MMRTSRLPSCTVALHNTPRQSHESDYMGFLGKKRYPSGVCALFCSKFLILCYMIRSMICDPALDPVLDRIRDPVRYPIHDPIQSDLIRSDPIRSDPIQILSAPQTRGHLKSFKVILEITQGYFRLI